MQTTDTQEAPWPKPAVAWFGVGVLVVAFTFSFIDRIVIALLVDPIRADLGISDTQIGFLQGFAFVIFYVFAGLPIGRLADRHSRPLIIGVGIFLWSLMTACCGLARNFWHLFLARVGVAVGEAALSPAAYSMISDYFPKEKLGRALGVYQAGGFLGIGIAFLAGGAAIKMVSDASGLALPVVGYIRPWQFAFIAVGLPGILVTLLVCTLRDPVRRGKLAGHETSIPLRQAIGFVFRRRQVFFTHFAGFALLTVPISTIASWAPTYFIRTLGYDPFDAAKTLGLIVLFFSPAGVYFGGWLTDYLQKRGRSDATVLVGSITAIALIPLGVGATQVSGSAIAIGLYCPFVFVASLPMALAPTALQIITPNQLRAQVSAIWLLVLNLVAAGLTPLAVGFLTDTFFADDLAVGSSISLVNGIALPLAGLILWRARKPFRHAAEKMTS